MRCLAMDCCSCCWVMAGNWSEVIVVPLWRLWSHQDQISCWCLSLNHWSCWFGFRWNMRISLSHCQMSCCCLVAAGISSVVCDWWLCCYCYCHSDCSCWLGNCCHQDLKRMFFHYLLFTSLVIFSSFVDKEQGIDFRFKALRVLHTLNSLLHSCSWV